jgi:hypothetical protein
VQTLKCRNISRKVKGHVSRLNFGPTVRAFCTRVSRLKQCRKFRLIGLYPCDIFAVSWHVLSPPTEHGCATRSSKPNTRPPVRKMSCLGVRTSFFHVRLRSQGHKSNRSDPLRNSGSLLRQRYRIIGRRIDLERSGGQAGHRKAADRCDQRHQPLEPHCLFLGRATLVAQPLVGEISFAKAKHVRSRPPRASLRTPVRTRDSARSSAGRRRG